MEASPNPEITIAFILLTESSRFIMIVLTVDASFNSERLSLKISLTLSFKRVLILDAIGVPSISSLLSDATLLTVAIEFVLISFKSFSTFSLASFSVSNLSVSTLSFSTLAFLASSKLIPVMEPRAASFLVVTSCGELALLTSAIPFVLACFTCCFNLSLSAGKMSALFISSSFLIASTSITLIASAFAVSSAF